MLITARQLSLSTVWHMTSQKIRLRADRDHIESLQSLTKLRCLEHGDMVMAQKRDGKIVFWCGCVMAGKVPEKLETNLRHKVVDVKR